MANTVKVTFATGAKSFKEESHAEFTKWIQENAMAIFVGCELQVHFDEAVVLYSHSYSSVCMSSSSC